MSDVQNLVDAAVQNGSRTVVLGPGRHETAGITITSGPFVLRGAGPTTIVVGTTPSVPVVRIAGTTATSARNISIGGMEISRDNPSTGSIGISVDNTFGLVLEDLSLWHHAVGIWIGRQSNQSIEAQFIRISDSIVRGLVPATGSCGIRLGGGVADVSIDRVFTEGGERSLSMEFNSNGILISDCNFQTASAFGVVSIGEGFARQILQCIVGSSFLTNQAVYAVMSGGQHAFRLRIANCWLESGNDHGILADVKDGLAIHDNRVGQFAKCGIRIQNSDRISVTGNYLEGNVRTGAPSTSSASMEIESCTKGVVVNNIVGSVNGQRLIWFKGSNPDVIQTPNIEYR
jgi:hypothetical protein